MSDIKLFCLSTESVQELKGQSLALERSLQTLMEKNLETLLGVRFLASEYSTGLKHKGRIDSLGIDENGCPVIIEYKRTSNENVINQGLFYLDWLMDHQAEFQLLVMERLGALASESIEWSSPRLLCIAGDFTRYDEHAVAQINRNIELIRYRHYPEGFLILEMVNAVTVNNAMTANKASSRTISAPPETVVSVGKTVSDYLEQATPELKELYQDIEDYLFSLGEDVSKKILKHYIAFKRIKNFACLEVSVQTKRLTILVKVVPSAENIVEGFTRDVSKIGHLGTGDLEISLRNKADLERAKPILDKSYQSS